MEALNIITKAIKTKNIKVTALFIHRKKKPKTYSIQILIIVTVLHRFYFL